MTRNIFYLLSRYYPWENVAIHNTENKVTFRQPKNFLMIYTQANPNEPKSIETNGGKTLFDPCPGKIKEHEYSRSAVNVPQSFWHYYL